MVAVLALVLLQVSIDGGDTVPSINVNATTGSGETVPSNNVNASGDTLSSIKMNAATDASETTLYSTAFDGYPRIVKNYFTAFSGYSRIIKKLQAMSVRYRR